jgi:hypothetical protein
MSLTILVSGPKQPGDCIDVYLRPLVDDLEILWNPGVKEVWDEFKRDEFTMCTMLFTTINDNSAHRNLSGQSKRKGAACPHCLEDNCAVWLRHSKKGYTGTYQVETNPSVQTMETSIGATRC